MTRTTEGQYLIDLDLERTGQKQNGKDLSHAIGLWTLNVRLNERRLDTVSVEALTWGAMAHFEDGRQAVPAHTNRKWETGLSAKPSR
jgi:hypothetical protein